MSNVNNGQAKQKAKAMLAQADPELRAALLELAARQAPSFPSPPPSPFPGNGLLVPPTPPASATALALTGGASAPPLLPTLHEFGQGGGVASSAPRPSQHIPREKDPDFDQMITTLYTQMLHVGSTSDAEAEKVKGIVSAKEKLEQQKEKHVNAAADAHRLLNVYERLMKQERANNEAHNKSAKETQQQIDLQADLEDKSKAAYHKNQKTTRNLKFLVRPSVSSYYPCASFTQLTRPISFSTTV